MTRNPPRSASPPKRACPAKRSSPARRAKSLSALTRPSPPKFVNSPKPTDPPKPTIYYSPGHMPYPFGPNEKVLVDTLKRVLKEDKGSAARALLYLDDYMTHTGWSGYQVPDPYAPNWNIYTQSNPMINSVEADPRAPHNRDPLLVFERLVVIWQLPVQKNFMKYMHSRLCIDVFGVAFDEPLSLEAQFIPSLADKTAFLNDRPQFHANLKAAGWMEHSRHKNIEVDQTVFRQPGLRSSMASPNIPGCLVDITNPGVHPYTWPQPLGYPPDVVTITIRATHVQDWTLAGISAVSVVSEIIRVYRETLNNTNPLHTAENIILTRRGIRFPESETLENLGIVDGMVVVALVEWAMKSESFDYMNPRSYQRQ